MLKLIDRVIDRVTMYRLLLYYLIALLVAAVVMSSLGIMHYNPIYIIVSTGILLLACWITNEVFASIFNAPVNGESSLITALILALLITPNPTGFGITFLLAASGLAISSKYLITIRKKHIFNPAAIGVALTAFGPRQSASWWVGAAVMLPFVIVGGILIVRKIRREHMVFSFLGATFIATILYSLLSHASISTNIHSLIVSSPVFFLGFVMLTEPLTSPPTAKKQAWYGALVGVLLPPQVHLLSVYSSPELSLLVGNAFSYIVSPKVKLFPVLKEKLKIAAHTAEFVFTPDRKLAYQPGQYIEWTLPHDGTDSRGSRRYFTLASSPTEPDIRIGVKFYENGSSFKEALLDMDEDTLIVASQLAGDFLMPKDTSEKLVFIAGGIGITPFRSMVKYMVDKNEKRTVTLLYSARTRADIAYKNLFSEAKLKIGLDTVYALTGQGQLADEEDTITGTITAELIKQKIPDYLERKFYLSGTHPMVTSIHNILSGLGVRHENIKIDYFPGYA